MTVTSVVARMYNATPVGTSNEAAAEKDFSQVMSAAVNEEKTPAECSCSNEKTADRTVTSMAAADNDGEVRTTAVYRFTMFIRISSDFSAAEESLAGKFREATRRFVEALGKEENRDVAVLDKYLDTAGKASNAGIQQSRSFIDSMLEAADKGLKAITASMTGSSWFSGLNLLSGTSGGLTSASPADIAKVYLQDSLSKTSSSAATSSSGSVSRTSYGNYQLEMVKGAAAPVKVDSAGNSSAMTSQDSQNTKESKSVCDRILEMFLQLLDDLESERGNTGIVKAGLMFSWSETRQDNGTETGKAIGKMNTTDSLQESQVTETAAEKITA